LLRKTVYSGCSNAAFSADNPRVVGEIDDTCPEGSDVRFGQKQTSGGPGATSNPTRLRKPVRISAASNAMAGRPEQARETVHRLQRLNPTLRVSNLNHVLGPYRRAEDLARYEDGLRKAGLPE
jgi:hypothetical protein